jgi:meso-butanediol dehydrogenase/(S,S)-butanediol dehydrogenase/diacetyl reductase
MTIQRRFEDKVAIVTGGASGMGRATAIRFAAEGASVFTLDVNAKGLAEVEAEVKESGGTIQTAVVDITSRDACFGAVKSAVDVFGRVDVLANIAGIVRFAHSDEMPEAEWNLVLAVNLSGAFYMCQATLPHLLESEGNIVNVASNAGLMGQAYTTAYVASKHALIGMSKSLALEYMKRKIRVNVVAPGGTDTNMNLGIEFPEGADVKLIRRYMGMRGFADPSEIASSIAFVASDEARSIHGAVLSVDNGMMAD